MSANHQFMEHRWGARLQLDARAELFMAEGASGFGVVRNASLSGAWIESDLQMEPLARVAVQPVERPGEWLDGCVVRVAADGFALEWLDPGLHAVSALLSLRKPAAPKLPEGIVPEPQADEQFLSSAFSKASFDL